MSQQLSQIESEKILKDLERKRLAEEILAKPTGPYTTLQLIVFAATAGISALIVEAASLPHTVGGLLVGLCVGVVGLAIDSWSTRKRLEAAVQLLKLKQGNPE